MRGRRFRQLLLKRIASERSIPVESMTLYEMREFPRNEWGHVGTIEITYAGGRWHALYGFDALAEVRCYAD